MLLDARIICHHDLLYLRAVKNKHIISEKMSSKNSVVGDDEGGSIMAQIQVFYQYDSVKSYDFYIIFLGFVQASRGRCQQGAGCPN